MHTALRPEQAVSQLNHPLKPHQQRVVNRICRRSQLGLVVAHGLGSGKTLTSIAAQEALGLDADIVVPATLIHNYEKEVTFHLSTPSQLRRTIRSLQAVTKRRELMESPLLIVDEAHRAREGQNVTFRNIFRTTARKRLCLTASPFYNHPADLAPLINLASGDVLLPNKREDFETMYIEEVVYQPSWWERLIYDARPYVRRRMNGLEMDRLQNIFEAWVDYHPNSTDDFPRVNREDILVDMTQRQQLLHDSQFHNVPRWVRFMVEHLLTAGRTDFDVMNSFLTRSRQTCNVDSDGTSPKIEVAFELLCEALAQPRGKALVYSNFIEGGIMPYRKLLTDAGIAYAEYTGETKTAERVKMIDDYNHDRLRVLLVSSAAGEGLDLKGTRLVQILEPHFNLEKIRQVEGRAIRYRSHAHLPYDERVVEVQRFLASRCSGSGNTTDQYMAKMADDKEALIEEFRGLFLEADR
jgi:SNF2 family DNA or RNA helicase